MKCYVEGCTATPEDGKAFLRISPVDAPAQWSCLKHFKDAECPIPLRKLHESFLSWLTAKVN